MDGYKFHHSALARGYVRVGHEVKEPYKGKFGRDPQGCVFLHGSVRCAGRAVLGAKRRPCMGRELEGHKSGVF